MKVFLLEDDENVAFGIKTYLEKKSYKIDHFSSIEDGLKGFNRAYGLLILDINLGDGTAYDFLSEIKEVQAPVIFLTVNNSEEEIVRGLNFGDDYITKPFKLSILEARIENILKRTGGGRLCLSYKDLYLDEDNYRAFIGNKDLGLSLKEYQVLNYLMVNRGQVLTRDKLLMEIWDIKGDFVQDNTLSATVKRLRKKLGDYSSSIETLRGIGYRFKKE